MRNENDTQASIARFHQAYIGQAIRFPPRLIFNVDQTGFNYEVYRDRTLARKGQRDVDSQSKRTHSYTAQPMISRDGRTFGKLLICLQERNDQFGPRVGPSIRDMESRFNNILAVASKSGKMTQVLMREWIDRVLAPALQEEVRNAAPEEVVGDGGLYDPEDNNLFAGDERRTLRPEVLGEQPDESNFNCAMDFIRDARIVCSQNTDAADRVNCRESARNMSANRCYRTPNSLLLVDSWGGQTDSRFRNELHSHGVQLLQIPKHTTGDIQPLDVTFMRQYKKFVKRIIEEGIQTNRMEYLSSREGILNMHSLIWGQFSSEAYTDMLRYSWRHTDPAYSAEELAAQPVPPMVQEIQFNFDASKRCEAFDCPSLAFIKCSHCGRLHCLHHFLQRVCYHDSEWDEDIGRAGPSNEGRRTRVLGRAVSRGLDPVYSDWERHFYRRLSDLYSDHPQMLGPEDIDNENSAPAIPEEDQSGNETLVHD